MDARTIAVLVIAAALPAAAASDGYVGSRACAGCHKKLYETYVKTPMGRAMTPAADHLGLAASKSEIASDELKRRFEVFVENGKLFQSESGDGFRSAHPAEYAIGSGMNGISFVVRRGDHLFQAPLSWYARTNAWALSPGYEFADYGFNRPIAALCIACHSGRPQPIAGGSGKYAEPAFRELSIGCENCHGPGDAHVRKVGAKAAIVNPARLKPALADDICMNCHQGGDTRVLQPGRTMADFRPGQPLNHTVAIFKMPRTREAAADIDLLEHHESMRISRCFRASGGKMGCLSCHNPHAAKIDYRAKCLECHIGAFPTGHPARTSDCVACHMPKRDIGFIAHSALTNHRIVREPGQPLPGEAFQQSTDLVHFNPDPNRPLPLLTLMQAYGELAEKRPEYYARYQELLNRAAKAHLDDPLVLAALGRRSLRDNAADAAIAYLTKAVERGSVASTTYEDLGEALSRADRAEEAVKVLQRGIELSPYTPVLHKSLALRLIKLRRYPEAKQQLERYVELFPEDDFVRKLLAQVSAPR